MKSADGGVFDTTFRFHTASAAFIQPARRPMRGSGVGGVRLMFTGDGVDGDDDGPQPAAVTRVSARAAWRGRIASLMVQRPPGGRAFSMRVMRSISVV